MSFLRHGAPIVLSLVSIGACGGKTAGPATTGTSDGTAGSTAPGTNGTSGSTGLGFMTGDDPGSGSPGSSTPGSSAGGSTSSNPGGAAGSSTPEMIPFCQQICDRVAEAGCAVNDCLKQCSGSVIANPACRPLFDAALQCFAQAPIGCTADGAGATFYGCDPARNMVNSCVAGSTTPPPNQCAGAAPVPPAGMMCAGGGSGGTTSGGGNIAQTCESECRDGQGNVWSSYCVGSNCSCIYNGKTYCSCVSAAPCSSCCPGIL